MSRSRQYWLNLARFALVVVGIAALGLGIAGVWLAYSRALLLVHPSRAPITQPPREYGLTSWEQIAFITTDGLEIKGWFIPPISPSNGAAVILAHGIGDNRLALIKQSEILAHHGYATLLFDFRNHGESQGTMTTLGYLEIEDVRGAVDYLSTRKDVDPQRIGLIGHSMGAGTAIRATARVPQIRALVAESAYTSIEDNVADGIRGLLGLPPFPFAPLVIWFGERETGLDIRTVRPIDDMAHIAPRPVMIIHGEEDPVIPVRNAQQLYAAAREPKRLYVIPNAGHAGLVEENPQEFERQLIDFLSQCNALAKCTTP